MRNRAQTFAPALLAAAMLPAPALAQSLPMAGAGTLSFSKTQAILGGAPSALEAIMAQQSGVAAPARAAIQPASYPRAPIVQATLVKRPDVSPGVTDGRPDVFGSVALRVGHTPLDARWNRVEHSPVTGTAARFAESQRGKAMFERLEAVNWYINRRIRFVDDSVQYGRADVWATANETLRRNKGDCEDYAIAKLQLLRRAGVSDRDLYLVILRDLVRRADHAVLVVRAAGHMYVMDNGTDQLLDSESVSDYRPILTFAAGSVWTHGYRIQAPKVNIAAADSAPAPAGPQTDQRSRRASLLAFNTGFSR